MEKDINHNQNISLEEYLYDLPNERIAKYPLEDRSESKLLVYRDGIITHTQFKEILDFIPSNTLLIFNNTKVIHARLLFSRKTGAKIEIFCLEPSNYKDGIHECLNEKHSVTWKCLVGNRKKWKDNEVLELERNIEEQKIILHASLIKKEGNNFIIYFEWKGDFTFVEILKYFGNTPIPPYLNREAEPSDTIKYQTVYAQMNGAVAAPTAGLHFTQELFDKMKSRNVKKDFITLHVSTGTFQPIKTKYLTDHPMHEEQLVFTRQNIENLLNHDGRIICVGTTSLRTLESLYWFGVLIQQNPHNGIEFKIEKLLPYSFLEKNNLPDRKKSLESVLEYLKKKRLDTISGQTSLFLFPAYTFKMCDGLITNYHLPKSTLILLVAAFVGKDWRKIYNEALKNNYRFLSYGDSSLILPI